MTTTTCEHTGRVRPVVWKVTQDGEREGCDHAEQIPMYYRLVRQGAATPPRIRTGRRWARPQAARRSTR